MNPKTMDNIKLCINVSSKKREKLAVGIFFVTNLRKFRLKDFFVLIVGIKKLRKLPK